MGYSAQGFGKFGFYEIFKDVYKAALGSQAANYQTVGFLVSSACAEVIADCLLCPMEAVSISTCILDHFLTSFFLPVNSSKSACKPPIRELSPLTPPKDGTKS